MIRLILISLAGVRLQSKKDSHCESFFVFGLTPGRIETLAQSDAFTIITMKMFPEGDLRQRLNHHFIESIDSIFFASKARKGSFLIVQCQPVLSFTLKQRKETGAHSSLGNFMRE